VKLERVKPAFEVPPYAETIRAVAGNEGTAVFEGELLELAGERQVEVGFEYQEYLGFAEAMYNTTWTRTKLSSMNDVGRFQCEVNDLKPRTEYQYRAIVRHPKITMRGDHKRFRAK
jgi:alpha-L-fucosidase